MDVEDIPYFSELPNNCEYSTRFSKWQIIKNLAVLCIGFVMFFTAYNGLSMLQSTMNQSQGIGVVSQAITYAGFCVSALLLPKYVIKKIGCKFTLIISMMMYIPYIAANFYFNWFTMVPSAVLVGLSASLLWSAQCTYFNESAVLYTQQVVFGKEVQNQGSEKQPNNTAGIKYDAGQEKSKTFESLDCRKLSIDLVKTEPESQSKHKQPYKLNNYNSSCSQESPRTEHNQENLMVNNESRRTSTANDKVQILTMTPKKSSAICDRSYVNTAYSPEGSEDMTNLHLNNQVRSKGTPEFIDCDSHQHDSASRTMKDHQKARESMEDSINKDEHAVKCECEYIKDSTSDPNIPKINSYSEKEPLSKIHKVELNKHIRLLQSEVYSKTVSSITARFFGLFGLLFRTSDIWSNLLSYNVLKDGSILDNITADSNCSCGASFCNVESDCFEHNLAEPSQYMRNVLTAAAVALAVLAVLLVFLFLDELEEDRKPVKFSFSLAMATCKFVQKPEALFLFPLSTYIGLQQGFYIGDFTKSYIACAWGVYHVGLVTIAYGMFAGVASTLAGFLVKYLGRIPVMITGALVNAAVNVFLLMWSPLPDQANRFFLAAAMWGVAVGILWSQLRAFYGVVFSKDAEAAFGGFYLWDSIGYCVAFSYSNYICTYIKIYVLLAVSSLGIIGYLRTESIYALNSNE